MTAFLVYIGKVAVLLAVFYLFYRLLMERETFHRLNRAVLLLSILASFVLPLCVITTHQVVSIPMPEVSGQQAETAAMPATSPSYWPAVMLIIYVIGLSAKLLYTIYSTIRLHRFISRLELHPQADGIVIAVSHQDIAPFSWWNTIVLSRRDYETNDPALIAHEQAHIQGYHSVDILLMEILLAVQWFNPAVWLMSRDLRTIHEYEADAAVLARGIDAHHYLSLLMERANTVNHYALTNGISQKILKSRFLMMARHRSKPSHIFRLLYALPVIGCALALNAHTVTDIKYLPTHRSVKGYANDQDNNPIAGVQVSVKGKGSSTVSDCNGEYYVNATDGDTIVWTYQGESSSLKLQPDYNYVALQQDLTEEQQHQQQTLRKKAANEQQALSTPAQIHISGLVLDDQGQPIEGAIVKVQGQTLGTVTDFDGCFSLDIPQGSTIDVMYIGMETCSFTNLNEPANFKIMLPKDNSNIK